MCSCSFFREGHGINGWYCYCDAATLSLNLTKEQMESIGCNEQQRQRCRALMQWAVGFGFVPEPKDANEK